VTAGVKVAAMLPLIPLIFLLPEEGRLRIGKWSCGGGANSNPPSTGGNISSGYSSSYGTESNSGGNSGSSGGEENGGLSTDEGRRLLLPLPGAVNDSASSPPSRVRSAGRRREGTNFRPGSGHGRRGAAEGSAEQTLLTSSTDEEAPGTPCGAQAQQQQQQQQQNNHQTSHQQQQRHHHHHARPARNESTFSLRL
jgi:hypothetical protein